ncbi:hypothetical protein EZV61_15740 [Corallincola luteus]|uniref:Two-component sensor histidine kinase n=1 Tax=Corallincola luteus TaxID=1775177 RepID=A0ABY2AJ92_9GAMM|nr:hypothetical protein [Corallincola luteus]TCI02025.1 hypothetical protein EZV61_15740 [Corallincola luteus]
MIRKVFVWLCGYLLLFSLAGLALRLYVSNQYLAAYDEVDRALIQAVDSREEFLGQGLTAKRQHPK